MAVAAGPAKAAGGKRARMAAECKAGKSAGEGDTALDCAVSAVSDVACVCCGCLFANTAMPVVCCCLFVDENNPKSARTRRATAVYVHVLFTLSLFSWWKDSILAY